MLLVGSFEPFDEAEYLRCGADAVLEKPFEPEALIRLVETLVLGQAVENPLVVSPARIIQSHRLRREVARPGFDKRLRVFLCHAHQDKAAAREIYRTLRKHAMIPWFDEEALLPGEDWNLAIQRALKDAHAVLVCVSSTSVSKTGYVQKEITKALDLLAEQPEGAIFVIPVLLEDCQLPDRLRHLQAARLHTNEGWPRLLAALKRRAADLGLAVPTES